MYNHSRYLYHHHVAWAYAYTYTQPIPPCIFKSSVPTLITSLGDSLLKLMETYSDKKWIDKLINECLLMSSLGFEKDAADTLNNSMQHSIEKVKPKLAHEIKFSMMYL